MVEIVLLRTLGVKRDAGKGTPAKALFLKVGFEVVDFVATTRRWHDRGNPRDAGECYACQSPKSQRGRFGNGAPLSYIQNNRQAAKQGGFLMPKLIKSRFAFRSKALF